jgi:hypothetical protein
MHTTANEWARVVIHPLGLAGFVLFLVFRLLAGLKSRDERRWLFPSAILMAVTAWWAVWASPTYRFNVPFRTSSTIASSSTPQRLEPSVRIIK